MRMRVRTVLLALIAGSSWTCFQSTALRISETILVPIDSIDPHQTDDSDLMFLKKEIGNSRVVLLGEQQHGDGATFLAKTRLIQFLYHQMQFDVLAFESGLFETALAWNNIRDGHSASHEVDSSLYAIWARSAQCQRLFQFVDSLSRTSNPLELAGFDCAFSGSYAQSLNEKMETFAKAHGFEIDAVIADVIDNLNTPRGHALSLEDQRDFFLECDTLIASFKLLSFQINSGQNDPLFWRQVVMGFQTYARIRWTYDVTDRWSSLDSLRDKQMADNLLFLVDHMFRDRKVIVWAANSHISNGLDSVEDRNGYIRYHPRATMGKYLREKLGTQMYSISFTSSSGQYGLPWTRPVDVPQLSTESIEYQFHTSGQNVIFLSYSKLPMGHWLRHRQVSRTLSHTELRSTWANMFDAVIYIRTMTPSTRIDVPIHQ
jgi:erythromycin esterase